MVRGVVRILYREVKGLHQAAYVLAFFALGSQMLAIVRDRVLAHEFGAGSELDTYYTAFKIPDLLFVLFSSVLSVYVLIPFLSGFLVKGDKAGARAFLSHVFSVFVLVYSVLAVILFFLMPTLVAYLFPYALDQEALVLLSRILLLQPFLLGVSSLLGVITQSGHRFVLYAVSPLVYNLGIIFGVTVLYPLYGLSGLTWGVVLGALCHGLIQVPLVYKEGLEFRLSLSPDVVLLKDIVRMALPRALTLTLNQLVLFVLVILASTLVVGSVAVLQLAINLQSVPLAIIGVSYSVAAFPSLAAYYNEQKMQAFAHHIMTAIRHIIFWSVPIVFLCIVLRAQLVRVILGSGSFDWSDTRLTAAVFAVLMFSLVAQSLNLLLIRAFYAGRDTRTPLYITFWTSLASIFMAVVFLAVYQIHPEMKLFISDVFRVTDVVGSEVLPLALGYSSGVILQSLLLLVMLFKKFKIPATGLWTRFYHALFASIMGALAAYTTLNFVVNGLQTDTFIGIFIQGALAGFIGVCGVLLGYYALGSKELHEVVDAVERRLFKTDVIEPEEDLI